MVGFQSKRHNMFLDYITKDNFAMWIMSNNSCAVVIYLDIFLFAAYYETLEMIVEVFNNYKDKDIYITEQQMLTFNSKFKDYWFITNSFTEMIIDKETSSAKYKIKLSNIKSILDERNAKKSADLIYTKSDDDVINMIILELMKKYNAYDIIELKTKLNEVYKNVIKDESFGMDSALSALKDYKIVEWECQRIIELHEGDEE